MSTLSLRKPQVYRYVVFQVSCLNQQFYHGMCSYCCSWISNILSALQCFDSVGWAAGRAPGLQKTEW